MCKISDPAGSRDVASQSRFFPGTKWLLGLVVMALLLSLGPAKAQEPEDDYLQIYALIQQAESLDTSGQAGAALAKYREVQTALQNFQQNHRDWNAKIISTRLRNVGQRIATLSETLKAASAAAGKEGQQSDASAAKASSTDKVKLLEAGAEPRKVLRLHPKAGDKQTLDLTLKLATSMKAGETPGMEIKLPAIKMTADVAVKSVSDDGSITYEMVMGEANVADEPGAMAQVIQAAKASFASVKGLSVTGTVSDRGISKAMNAKVPSGVDPQGRETIGQMTDIFKDAVSLPEEAVGPGARWEVKAPIKSQGITIEQTTVYQLVSIEGERLKLKGTVEQHASNQKIQSPAMSGMKMDLIKMAGKGTDDLTIDLAQLLPSEATSELETETSMAMTMGGQKQAMTQKMNLKFILQAK